MSGEAPLQNLFQPAAPKGEPERGPKETRKQREAKQPPAAEPAKPTTRRRRQQPQTVAVLKRVLKLLHSVPPADAKGMLQMLSVLFE